MPVLTGETVHKNYRKNPLHKWHAVDCWKKQPKSATVSTQNKPKC